MRLLGKETCKGEEGGRPSSWFPVLKGGGKVVGGGLEKEGLSVLCKGRFPETTGKK